MPPFSSYAFLARRLSPYFSRIHSNSIDLVLLAGIPVTIGLRMTDEQILSKINELLEHFHMVGIEQVEMFKTLNPGPVRRTIVDGQMMGELDGVFMPLDDVIRRIVAKEDLFLVDLLGGFWNYYLLNKSYLESPARQGIDRTLLEYCYQKLVFFTKLTTADKKRKLLITRLCDIGIVLAAPSDQDKHLVPNYIADYNYFISQLSNQDDKARFQRFQDKGYPTNEFAKAKHGLWPSFFNAFEGESEGLVFPWADYTEECSATVKESFLRMYLHQHEFVHGSYTSAIAAVEAMSTKKHLFTSVSIAIQTGYQILYTINETYLGDSAIELSTLLTETNEIMPHVISRFSHLN
jgi:hypothetical protein